MVLESISVHLLFAFIRYLVDFLVFVQIHLFLELLATDGALKVLLIEMYSLVVLKLSLQVEPLPTNVTLVLPPRPQHLQVCWVGVGGGGIDRTGQSNVGRAYRGALDNIVHVSIV